jgi:hypothetical protein
MEALAFAPPKVTAESVVFFLGPDRWGVFMSSATSPFHCRHNEGPKGEYGNAVASLNILR